MGRYKTGNSVFFLFSGQQVVFFRSIEEEDGQFSSLLVCVCVCDVVCF